MTRYVLVLTGRTNRDRCDAFDLFAPFGMTVVVGPDALRVIGFDASCRDEAFALARRLGFDAALVPEGVRLSDYGALFFDMDSTLCNSETLDEMADILGVGDECARITADAMAGRITGACKPLDPCTVISRTASVSFCSVSRFTSTSLRPIQSIKPCNPGICSCS